MQTSEAITAFIEAMEAAGVVPVESIASRLAAGGPIYFDCHGDKAKSRKGWAVLHLDGHPAGAFGHFKSGINAKWRGEPIKGLSRAERAQLQREAQAAKAKRVAEQLAAHEAAAEHCRAEWDRAGPADPSHDYLVRKGVTGEGLRQSGSKLLVPMLDADGTLWNVQTIRPDGTKLYAKGARQKGLLLLIGKPASTICVAEGFATAASIRRATGHAVAVAFAWSNLKAAALALREKYPTCAFVICADDDAHLIEHPNIKRNLGADAAHDAARAVGGRVAMPPRSPEHD